MNGLKWIMTHCNYETEQLAGELGIAIEKLKSWMENIALLPEDMKEKIAEYFGIESRYFVDLSDQQKRELLQKPLYIYRVEDGCEWYKFYPAQNQWKSYAYYIADRTETYRTEYRKELEDFYDCQKRFAAIFTDFSSDDLSESRIATVSRGQKYLTGYSALFEEIARKEPGTKMAFYDVLDEVMSALREAVERPLESVQGATKQWKTDLSQLMKQRIKEKLGQTETESPEKEGKSLDDMLLRGVIRSYCRMVKWN